MGFFGAEVHANIDGTFLKKNESRTIVSMFLEKFSFCDFLTIFEKMKNRKKLSNLLNNDVEVAKAC